MFSKSNQVGYCVTFIVGAYMYKTIYYMYARSYDIECCWNFVCSWI